MNKIIFTGGGSGGHVVPALTLIKKIRELRPEVEILYIGGRDGIERELITKEGITYESIYTGKLRRYLSLKNVVDIFKILIGLFQSILILFKHQNQNTTLFATGGFVAVTPVIAAKLWGVRVFIHEQTSRAGLANRICAKFADHVLVSFESSKVFFPSRKVEFLGLPLRDSIFDSHINEIQIDEIPLRNVEKPILFITGGGNGSLCLNEWVKESLSQLKEKYFVIHQVGKLFEKEYSAFKDKDYHPTAFVGEEMVDLLKLSHFVVSRAGANTVLELRSLGKKSIFVPLKIAQKNEQYYNAKASEEEIGSLIIEEDALAQNPLINVLNQLDPQDFQKINPAKVNPTEKILKRIFE